MAERPATSSAGPCKPRPVISRPSEAVASFPWVYRLGEQKTDNIVLASDGETEMTQMSAVQPAGSPLPVGPIEGFQPITQPTSRAERSFAWLERDRRRSQDEDWDPASSAAWVKISAIGGRLRRVAPDAARTPAPVMYRKSKAG